MNLSKYINAFNWATKHRQNGVPIEHFNDKDYLEWHAKYKPGLLKYKDIHLGEDCFIIGNGPSLNKTDVSRLNNFHTFGLNKIHLLFEKHPLNLSYHVSVNPLVIEQITDELRSDVFKCPSFLSYLASQHIDFAPGRIHKILTNAQWSFYKDLTSPISEGYTVTYVAMQIAYYMGFRNVFLVGVDHSFVQSGKPNEKQLHETDDANHFHPDYFKGQNWHLADLEGNEASYSLAKYFFRKDGREIYDATIGGKLQIFPKISFEEALEKCKKRAH